MTTRDEHHVIIPHTLGRGALLVRGAHGWTLPSVRTTPPPGDWRWRYVAVVNQALREQYGLDTTVLRYVSLQEDPETRHLVGVVAAENHRPDWTPPQDTHWIRRGDMEMLEFALPEHRSLLETWFAEMEQDEVPPLRRPWAQPGWFEEASAWIRDRLAERGLTITAPVEQVRSWFISCILRIPTTDGVFWFKVAPPSNAYEPPLTQALAADYPGLLPQVLVVDAERRWLLTKDIAGVNLNRHPDRERYLPRWEDLLRAYARLQRDYANHTEQLLAWGCPDWRPAALAAGVDAFFAGLTSVLSGDRGVTGIDDGDLPVLASQIKRLCARMEEYRLPASFVHWDFHSGNVLAGDTECRVIDWTGGVGHPFTGLSVVYEEHSDAAVQARLRDIYLEAWAKDEAIERLREACDLALPLAALQNVMGTFTQTMDAEAPWEREVDRGSLLWYLKHLRTLVSATEPRA